MRGCGITLGAAVVVVEMVRGCCRYAMWQWVMVVAVMSQEAVMGACMVRGDGGVRGQSYMGRWADGRLRSFGCGGVLGVGGDRWNNGRFKGDVVMAF